MISEFSVAVILNEMLTGERPFEGQSITRVLYKIVHEVPIAPRKLDGTIHPGLSAIIDKGLAKAPEARFSSGSEFAAGLENYRQLGSGLVSTGNMPPADPPHLAETAALTQTNLSTVPHAQSMAYQMGQSATPVLAPSSPPPALPKKRGLSPFLLGCVGLVALGIVALTIVILAAIFRGNDKRLGVTTNPGEVAKVTPTQPNPPPAATAAVVKTSPAKSGNPTATLKLSSTPPGAEILLDGKLTDRETPASVTITRGEHTIAVKMTGFQDASAKFKVSGGEEFEFSPELGVDDRGHAKTSRYRTCPLLICRGYKNSSTILGCPTSSGVKSSCGRSGARCRRPDSSPSWSAAGRKAPRFLSTGRIRGRKREVLRSEPGRYAVRVELDGYAAFEKVVTVRPNGSPTTVHARLTPKTQ